MKKKRKKILTFLKTENFGKTRQKTQKKILFLRGAKRRKQSNIKDTKNIILFLELK
jgi:hypothetical protein